MKAKILRKRSGTSPNAGTILEGRTLFKDLFSSYFQCTQEGPHLGMIFEPFDFEKLPDEGKEDPAVKTLQNDIRIRDVRIERLIDERDGARVNEQRAVAAAERMAENVAQLEKERQELADKLLAKKVVLPREVAQDIEQLLHFHDGMIYSVAHAFVQNISISKESSNWLSGFRDCNHLMNALVNGYTVEDPPTAEDRIRDNLSAALIEMNVSSPVSVERLATVLTLAVRNVLAEDRQEETQ